jgi:hypothetical protein
VINNFKLGSDVRVTEMSLVLLGRNAVDHGRAVFAGVAHVRTEVKHVSDGGKS